MTGVNNVLETFMVYTGSSVWRVLLLMSVAFLVWKIPSKRRWCGVLFILGLWLLLYNDFSRNIIGKVTSLETYYRFFWLIPVTLIVALALTVALCAKGPGVLRWGIVAVAVVVVVTKCGVHYGWKSWQMVPQNKYIVSNDLRTISTLVHQDTEKEKPVVAAPLCFDTNFISYDADVQMAIGRPAYAVYIGREPSWTEDAELASRINLLIALCNEGIQNDVLEVKNAIIRQKVDYLIVPSWCGLEDYMSTLGCTSLGVVGDMYIVYRYNGNFYDTVVDEKKVDEIKQVCGINEDVITIDVNGKKEHTLIVVNDVHNVLIDSSVVENRQAVYDRFGSMFRSNTGLAAVDEWAGMSSILDSYNADGIVFMGDMIDYHSMANFGGLIQGFQKIKTPFIYLRADHDLGIWYTAGALTEQDAKEASCALVEWQDVFIRDYDDFYLLGWNNSTSQMTQEGLELTRQILRQNKPVVLATHVPINSLVDDELELGARASDSKGRAKLWGKGCLYEPDDTTQAFLDMVLADDSPVVAVLAGHLHYKMTTMLTDKIPEYILDKSYTGNIGVVTVQ